MGAPCADIGDPPNTIKWLPAVRRKYAAVRFQRHARPTSSVHTLLMQSPPPRTDRIETRGPVTIEVFIEVPRGSFLKRGISGTIDFIAPLPCPFNYGSVEKLIGLEGDLLDAVVLGPRLPFGTRTIVTAYGAVGLTDRGMYDDKLICSTRPIGRVQRRLVVLFFHFYARCKALLNRVRGRPGRNACEGWCSAADAISRARPRPQSNWDGSPTPF